MRAAAAPGTSQRWMWPLGSPDGSGSLLGLRPRRWAGFCGACLASGRMGPPSAPAMGGGSPRPTRAPAPGSRPSKERTFLGPPPHSPTWRVPPGLTWPRAASWGVWTSRSRAAAGSWPLGERERERARERERDDGCRIFQSAALLKSLRQSLLPGNFRMLLGPLVVQTHGDSAGTVCGQSGDSLGTMRGQSGDSAGTVWGQSEDNAYMGCCFRLSFWDSCGCFWDT